MRLDQGDDIAAAGLSQHERLEAALRALERVDDGTDAFGTALEDLRAAFLEHVGHQERVVLPASPRGSTATISTRSLPDASHAASRSGDVAFVEARAGRCRPSRERDSPTGSAMRSS